MTDRQVQIEQDRLGNENKKLDSLRAQGGQVNSNNEGLLLLNSNESGQDRTVYSKRTDQDELVLMEIHAYNSAPSGDNTFHVVEGNPDSSNAGQMSNTTRRSVQYEVLSNNTRIIEYVGKPFAASIGVNSEFGGQFAVGIIEDRKEYTETNTEDTSTPS